MATLTPALWPLFHYLLWLDSTATVPSPDPLWIHYHQANSLFAAKVAEIYRPGDLIIVHDYHLLLAPKMIREALGTSTHVINGGHAGFATVTPSPALHERKGMDWEGTSPPKDEESKAGTGLGGMLGKVGSALANQIGLNGKKEEAEVMIGMFMHTPWPSSEIFRCLPSKCNHT